MPVPTAVPPRGTSPTRASAPSMRSAPWLIWAANPPNSWPSVTGVASMRWVRPDLTTPLNSSALRPREAARWASAGSRSSRRASATARWMAVGNTSLDDCEALTWSLGWTAPFSPSFSLASVARTSLMFMFDDVPEPVWKTSIGNSTSHSPSATSSAAAAMASAIVWSTSGTSSSPAFTLAASPLIMASARMRRRSMVRPEIGKFSTARLVWAAYLALKGTCTSPMESCSMRNPPSDFVMVLTLPRASTAPSNRRRRRWSGP